ncbi:MAG: hypothetical protein ACO1SX_19135, partial [Actinomycetota bacterium]
DPIVIDPGLIWYDVIGSDGFLAGLPEVNASGLPLTQYIEGVGLCSRAFMFPQDSRLSHGTDDGGSWEEREIATGRAAYRMNQTDSANSLTSWSWTFNSQAHPANPQFAFSLILPDTPTDWDFDTYPPFVRVEVGESYGVEFNKDGTSLVRYLADAWRWVADLPTPPRGAGFTDGEEIWLWFRVLEGQVAVSFDYGRSYALYSPPGEAVVIPAGHVVLRGRGGCVTGGLHQLKTFEGDWDSPGKNLERLRITATETFEGSRYSGSVAFTDLGNPLARQAQYRATLSPVPISGTLWDWYSSPVLRAVQVRIAPTVQTIGSDYTTPFDDDLVSIRISKPVALSGTTATVVFHVPAHEENSLEGYRWRKVELITGYHLSDGTDEVYTSLVGYVEEWSAEWSDELELWTVTWKIANASARFRRNPWGPFRQVCLAGQTPNAAADEILYWHGLNSSYRDWHAAGSGGVIDPGAPESPCELTNPTELPWETLERIFAERFLEVGVADDGTFFTLPKDYAGGSVTMTYHGGDPDGGDDERNRPSRISRRTDYKESFTAALVYGVDANGQFVFATAYDSEAETNVASARFSQWRECVLKEIPGTPHGAYLVGHCQALAQERFPLHAEADLVVPVDPRRSRRERVALYGYGGGDIPDGTEFVILTLEHTWEAGKGLTALSTQAGLRRI